MRVAVIVPAFNAASTLGSTLASVAAQTRPPDEVIVVDDGSSDDTAELARSWTAQLPVTVLATDANAGPSAARRAGIDAAAAPLIALLDADDVWFPDHLESMLAAYATTDDGLASADTLAWIPGRAVTPRSLGAAAPLPEPARQLHWLLVENHLSISSLFSRARYEAVGGFRPQFHGTEDWDLWIRMVRAGAVVARPDHPTVLYRLSRGAVSSDDRMVEARRAVLDAAAREGRPDEAAAVRLGLRHNRAAAALVKSYRLASEGRLVTSRFAALGALRGIRPVALRGAAMAVAPTRVLARRNQVRWDPDVWLRRFGA